MSLYDTSKITNDDIKWIRVALHHYSMTVENKAPPLAKKLNEISNKLLNESNKSSSE